MECSMLANQNYSRYLTFELLNVFSNKVCDMQLKHFNKSQPVDAPLGMLNQIIPDLEPQKMLPKCH